LSEFVRLFSLLPGMGFCGNRDTTLTTYLRNGAKKSQKVYIYKHYENKQKGSFLVLHKLKLEKYFANDGREIKEAEIFEWEYKEKRDYLRVALKQEYSNERLKCKIIFPM